jgi:peroxiredoxin
VRSGEIPAFYGYAKFRKTFAILSIHPRHLNYSQMPPLQPQLDHITTQTRALVQPERLAITDNAVRDLFATGIEDRILPVGAAAPSFALPDCINGKLIRSADLLAIGPLIVNFFRGRWCPYCMTELEAPQLPRQNDFTVQQHNLTFPILSDAGCRLAAQFGIAYTVPEPMQQHYRSILVNIPFINGGQGDDTWRLPLPATFVISQAGTVLFAEAHADHRVRPDPMDVLAVL